MMGLLDPVYRLPMVKPRPESLAKIEKVLEASGLLHSRRPARGTSNRIMADLKEKIEALFAKAAPFEDSDFELFGEFKALLNAGAIRAAEPDPAAPTGWRVNAWVKQGILAGFRLGGIVDMSVDAGRLPFFDKSTYPVKRLTAESGVRLVPGGSSIRDGCYVAGA